MLVWKSLIIIGLSVLTAPNIFFDLFGPNRTCSIVWASNQTGWVSSLAMSTDGRYIAMVRQPDFLGDTVLSLFDRNASSPEWNYSLFRNGHAFEYVSMAEDGSYISVSGDFTQGLHGVGVFSRSSGIPVWTLQRTNYTVQNLWFDSAISGNGQSVVVRGQMDTQFFLSLIRTPDAMVLWNYTGFYNSLDYRGGIPISTSYEAGYTATIFPTAVSGYFNPVGPLVLFSAHDNRSLWTNNGNWIGAIVSDNGDRVIARTNTTIRVFGNSDNRTIETITPSLTEPIQQMWLSRDGTTLAVASSPACCPSPETVRVYDVSTGQELFGLSAIASTNLAMSSDGATIATFDGANLSVYGRTGATVCTVQVAGSAITKALAISGNGQSITVGNTWLSYIQIVSSDQTVPILLTGLVSASVIGVTVFGGVLLVRRRRQHRLSQ